MYMNFKKRHQRFVDELRKEVIKNEKNKKSKFKVDPCEIIVGIDDSKIQAELEAKFDELFGSSNDD